MPFYLVESDDEQLEHRGGKSRGVAAEGYPRTTRGPVYIHILELNAREVSSLVPLARPSGVPYTNRFGVRPNSRWWFVGSGGKAHLPGYPLLRSRMRGAQPEPLPPEQAQRVIKEFRLAPRKASVPRTALMGQRFFAQAEADLLFARRNVEIGGFYVAANLAHQAAEKALKAAHWHLRAEEPGVGAPARRRCHAGG